MVVSPEDNNKYRLFLIGQKQLPEIVGGKSTSEEKNWALNILTTNTKTYRSMTDVERELAEIR